MPAPQNNKNASIFDLDLVKEICNKIADGENIKTVLKSNDKYPSYETFRRWKRDNEVVYALYVNAIQDKAEMVDAQIDEIWLGCKNGQYEPSVANVLIQTLKWKASKYYPKMYGDNKQIDLNVDDKRMTPEERDKRIQELKSKLIAD